jgi:hypothetical protein
MKRRRWKKEGRRKEICTRRQKSRGDWYPGRISKVAKEGEKDN